MALSANSWPYRLILGIIFGSRLMAKGRPGPCGPKERPGPLAGLRARPGNCLAFFKLLLATLQALLLGALGKITMGNGIFCIFCYFY